jgi:hypothetical protein
MKKSQTQPVYSEEQIEAAKSGVHYVRGLLHNKLVQVRFYDTGQAGSPFMYDPKSEAIVVTIDEDHPDPQIHRAWPKGSRAILFAEQARSLMEGKCRQR